MKKATFVLRWILMLLVCLGTFAAVSPASSAGNHCKDRCNQHYNQRKNYCKSLRYKHERQRCEDEVKREKDECKRHCG